MGLAARGIQTSRAFVEWWWAELAGMLPERLRRIRMHGQIAIISLDGQKAEISVDEAGGNRLIGTVALNGPDRAAACRLVALASPGRGCAARIRLPASSALRTTMRLPLVAEQNLREVIDFEMDRQTPFRPEQVHIAHHIVARDPAAHSLAVEVTLVLRSAVDQALRTCAALGIEPEGIEVARGGAGAQAADLLEAQEAGNPRGKTTDRTTIALAALAALLAVIAVALPVGSARIAAADAEQKFEAVRKQAELAADLSQRLRTLRTEANVLTAMKASSIPVSDLLLELTRLIPDDAWLTELQIENGEVRLSGFARSASDLVGAIEGSDLFHRTVFRAPVTLDTKAGRERFSLSARLEAEAAP